MIASALRDFLAYDPETGLLYWKERRESATRTRHRVNQWNSRFAGTVALNNLGNRGYKKGVIEGRTFTAHRVIWAWVNGAWPPEDMDLDHINGDKTDNRIGNLRLATRAENCRNRGANKGRTLPKGVAAVSGGRFRAMCSDGMTNRWLGSFSSIQEASKAYDTAARDWHGTFARLNDQSEAA